MKRVFLVGDTSNRTNWGCRATSYSLKRMLERHGELTGTLDIRALQARLRKGFPAKAGFVFQRWLVARAATDSGRRIKALGDLVLPPPSCFLGVTAGSLDDLAGKIAGGKLMPELRQQLEDCDVVLINGEGSFMSRRVAGRVKLLLGYTAKKYFGKAVGLVNHTADLRDPVLFELAAKTYPLFDKVTVRENFSMDLVKKVRPGQPVEFAADAVFSLEPAEREAWLKVAARENYFSIYPDRAAPFHPSEPYICVGGSSMYASHKQAGFNFQAAYTKLCQELMKLAPVVVTASSHPDDFFLRPVAEKLGLPYFGLNVPTHQALDVLAHASVYVGGRWHPKLMALTGGTPLVAFAANSDFKSRGALDLAGLEQPSISAYGVEEHATEFARLAEGYLSQGSTLKSKLRQRALELRETSYRSVAWLDHLS